MHKLVALRRVFHSGTRKARDGEPISQTSTNAPLSSAESATPPPPSSIDSASTSPPTRALTYAPPSLPFIYPPLPPPAMPEPVKASRSSEKSLSQPHRSTSTPRWGPVSPGVSTGHADEHCNYEPAPCFSEKPTLELFDLVKTVGTGSFGRVYMAKLRKTGAPYAIKRLIKAAVVKQKQVDHVLSEKSILSRMNHPFLVKMHATFQDPRYLYIVMEFVEGGEFFTFLRKSKRLDNDSARFYAGHVTTIFEYLHSMSVIYRDLKPENLLMMSNGYLKLTDFGFAKIVERRTYTLCGTPEYIAPEVLLNKGHGKAVDWWTLGILIYEMIVGYPPFFDEDALGIYQKILAGKIVFPRFFRREPKSLVKKLLTHDLGRRYGHIKDGLSDVRFHRWFADFDFDALLTKQLPAPYRPRVQAVDDTSNFGEYEEDAKQNDAPVLAGRNNDPFAGW